MNAEEIRKRLDDPSYLDRAVDAIADDIVDGRLPLSYEMRTGYIGASYGPRGQASADAIDMIYAGKGTGLSGERSPYPNRRMAA